MSHKHTRVLGLDGELLDRFMELLDQAPDANPCWWYDFSQLTLLRFTWGFIPRGSAGPAMTRDEVMTVVRGVLEHAITSGRLTEDFLVRSLKQDLDTFVRRRADPAAYHERVDDLRAMMRRVIDDPQARRRWRDSLIKVAPQFATMTDDDLVAQAHQTLTDSPNAPRVDAVDVAASGSECERFQELSEELLPDGLFEFWSRQRTRRAGLGGQRGAP